MNLDGEDGEVLLECPQRQNCPKCLFTSAWSLVWTVAMFYRKWTLISEVQWGWGFPQKCSSQLYEACFPLNLRTEGWTQLWHWHTTHLYSSFRKYSNLFTSCTIVILAHRSILGNPRWQSENVFKTFFANVLWINNWRRSISTTEKQLWQWLHLSVFLGKSLQALHTWIWGVYPILPGRSSQAPSDWMGNIWTAIVMSLLRRSTQFKVLALACTTQGQSETCLEPPFFSLLVCFWPLSRWKLNRCMHRSRFFFSRPSLYLASFIWAV